MTNIISEINSWFNRNILYLFLSNSGRWKINPPSISFYLLVCRSIYISLNSNTQSNFEDFLLDFPKEPRTGCNYIKRVKPGKITTLPHSLYYLLISCKRVLKWRPRIRKCSVICPVDIPYWRKRVEDRGQKHAIVETYVQ